MTEAQKLKRLETVGDVLAWAFKYLDIDGVCDDSYGWSANDICWEEREYIGAYNIAEKTICSADKECFGDCGGEDGDTCYMPTIKWAPSKPTAPQWGDEPPTEEGFYWRWIEGWESPTVNEVVRNHKNTLINVQTGREVDDLPLRIKVYWSTKIDPPPLPKTP